MTPTFRRGVVDTNALISAVLSPSSTPAAALELALRRCLLLRSDEMWMEFEDVLRRDKFDRYAARNVREQYAEYLAAVFERISVHSVIKECRDPKDDKFLALAVDGLADFLLTGDNDLLALHPFRGVAILTPTDFLARMSS